MQTSRSIQKGRLAVFAQVRNYRREGEVESMNFKNESGSSLLLREAGTRESARGSESLGSSFSAAQSPRSSESLLSPSRF
jgi:hypothetical protein